MEVKMEDICLVQGYRLTEHKVFDGKVLVKTYFNIRNNQGQVIGRNYDKVEWPLILLLNIDGKMIDYLHLNKMEGYADA